MRMEGMTQKRAGAQLGTEGALDAGRPCPAKHMQRVHILIPCVVAVGRQHQNTGCGLCHKLLVQVLLLYDASHSRAA